MANQDHFVGNNTNQANVVSNLKTAFELYPDDDRWGYNDDALWWATAAVYGYRAYTDSDLLANAITSWNHISQYVITQAQADSGMQPHKNFSIEGTCNGATMAGGVFWRPTIDDEDINSITTGLYIALSAFLAEIEKNSTYTNAAIASANWIKTHNLNSDYLVLDTVNARNCTTSPSTELFTYNGGKFVEGLSVLATVTGDSQWSDLALNITNAAVKTSVWGGSDGIITEGSETTENSDEVGFKAAFIRGLHEAYTRTSNDDLKTLIRSYIDVQYNALLDLAAQGDSYSANWHGPPQNFTTWGQSAAIDVLTAVIDSNN
ncbi:hypothetical protein PILCRDRAFT_252777 [Piloderma croceum F 1598]|uniref:Glycoside hydrolase family 76 protein n=1 Tax=Piloderma croceum (strain F 1598) TaxID=765440 RepID=A0A0C3FV34_PILCF|nr:hypothetical protein PILCRDRAFT_252777 [Piloderma croceum F 1598]